ncbi:MAG: peptidase M61, partial [Acidobacteriaceae bacterium]
DFNDIVQALNKVQPYDWASLLRDLVYKLHPQVPLEGFTQGGYQLVYNDSEPLWARMGGFRRFFTSYATSLGFSVAQDGRIAGMQWGSPAFKAGLAPGMTILAVNGNALGAPGEMADSIKDAIVQAEKDTAPIHFLVKKGDKVVDVDIDYHGGLRVPHLERIPNTPDRLDDILAAVK